MIKLKHLLSLLVLFLALPLVGSAQINLVLNPSFEDYSTCPSRWDQIKYATYWNGIDSTWNPFDSLIAPPYCMPDFVNTCSWTNFGSIPSNYGFNHWAHAGLGMVQCLMYYNEEDSTFPNKRDYTQGSLMHTLVAGHQYCVSFYTVLEQSSAYAIDHIGAFLDDGSIDTTTNCGSPQTAHVPQVYGTEIINDTLNWHKIQGTFTAVGNEKFITLGNFFDMPHTDTTWVHFPLGESILNHSLAWYLIDDVSLIDCGNMPQAGVDTIIVPGDSVYIGPHEGLLPYTWYAWGHTSPLDSGGGMWVHPDTTTTYILEQNLCGVIKYDTITITMSTDTAHHHVGIAPLAAKEGLHLYPNPASNELTLSGLGGSTQYRLMDVTGYVVRSGQMHRGVNKLNISALPTGSYIIDLIGEDGEKVTKHIVKE